MIRRLFFVVAGETISIGVDPFVSAALLASSRQVDVPLVPTRLVVADASAIAPVSAGRALTRFTNSRGGTAMHAVAMSSPNE